MKTTYTARDIIGNGQMAYDTLNDNGKFEWFKSEEDGYIYLLNRETGRAARYNSEGQNSKRISTEAYEEARKSLELRVAVAEVEESEATEEAKEIVKKNAPKKTRKSRRQVAREFEVNGQKVTLTEKQVDFIQHLPDTCFWEHGLDSTPLVDCLCDDIGGQFENKPMAVGAMISTLREKGLLGVGFGQYDGGIGGKGRKAKFLALTEVGKIVAGEILHIQ